MHILLNNNFYFFYQTHRPFRLKGYYMKYTLIILKELCQLDVVHIFIFILFFHEQIQLKKKIDVHAEVRLNSIQKIDDLSMLLNLK